MVILRYFATGGFQSLIADTLGRKIHQSTLSRCFQKGLDSIVQIPVISMPSPERAKRLARNSKFPGSFGSIDGTLIRIPVQQYDQRSFFCRKKFSALNSVVMCDSESNIIAAVCGFRGGENDSIAFKTTDQYRLLSEGVYDELFILGDSGFEHDSFIFTPFRHPDSEIQSKYNLRLCKERVKIECVFGIMKRCFNLLNRLNCFSSIETCQKVIYAACVLYNIRRKYVNISDESFNPEQELSDDDTDNIVPEFDTMTGGRYTRLAAHKRAFANLHFS